MYRDRQTDRERKEGREGERETCFNSFAINLAELYAMRRVYTLYSYCQLMKFIFYKKRK